VRFWRTSTATVDLVLPALTVSSSTLRRLSVICFGAAASAGFSSLPWVRRRKPSSFIFSVLLTT